MKTWKTISTFLVAGALCSSFLTACGKKSDDAVTSLTYGSLVSDGNTVDTSNTTIQGIPINIRIQGISSVGGLNNMQPQGQFQTCLIQPCANTSGNINFQIIINGMPSQPLTASANWTQWMQAGNWLYSQSGTCADAGCRIVLVSVVVAANTQQINEYLQIAVKKDITTGKIIALREFRLNDPSRALSPQNLIYQF